jgi:hypothetical protein
MKDNPDIANITANTRKYSTILSANAVSTGL